jgi:tRNA-dihydrouridine synthase 2
MVRAGSLPLRALSLKYEADLVWSEEIMDRKLISARRVDNEELKTVDFVIDKNTVILRISPEIERGKLILQMGTFTPTYALEAARKVENDVVAIDINMGCPKKFSTHCGGGAALLSNPLNACAIVRILSENLKIPITCKIRLLDTVSETIQFIRQLEEAGVSAITVHLRKRGVESTIPAELLVMRELVLAAKVPLIANGDMYSQKAISQMLNESKCAGVMLGRPVLLNASILIKSGKTLSQMTVLRDFITECIRFMPVYQVVKYTIMEMMVARRHTPSILEELKASSNLSRIEFGRVDPYYDQVCAARSVRDICAIFDMDKEYDKAVDDRLTEAALTKSNAHKIPNNNFHTDSTEVIVSAVIIECGKRKDIDAIETPAHR